MNGSKRSAFGFVMVLAGLLATSVGIQVARDRVASLVEIDNDLLYVPSGTVLDRVALSYDAVLADVYWIRAIQYYGGTKRSKATGKSYEQLYPLLDITTTLDPRFAIAYRFGAIFLCEAYPNGPGRPDLAVKLLTKGAAADPAKWQYLQDAGFVYYWWLRDYKTAAEWFKRASEVEGSPWWLRSLTATTMAQGGNREAARLLWEQLRQTADNDWLRAESERRLIQIRALDEIDQLEVLVQAYAVKSTRLPQSWTDLIRAGAIAGPPVDPSGMPYLLDPKTGKVDVSSTSPLFPLPDRRMPEPAPTA